MRNLQIILMVVLSCSGSLFSGAIRADEPTSLIAVRSHSLQQLELTQHHSEHVAIRWTLHDRDTRVRGGSKDTRILAEISQRGSAYFLDYHPFGNGFRLTTGLLFHDHHFELNGYSLTTKSFDNTRATIRYFNASPYLGIGVGGRSGEKNQFSYSFDLGVFDYGTPDVSVELPPNTGLTPGQARATSQREANLLRNELSENRLAPLLSFSLSWVF